MTNEYFDKLGIKIDERSFRECMVDLGKCEGKSIISEYPELGDWVEMRDDPKKYDYKINNNSVLKYIICMYDPKSPFRGLEYHSRKIASAIYAGFETSETGSGEFTNKWQEIMNGDVEIVNMMAIRYCSLTRGLEYATYKEFERRYYEVGLRDPDRKITDLEKDRTIIAGYRDTFLAQDLTVSLQRTFYKVTTDEEKKLRKLRPEYQQEFFYNRIAASREEINKAYKEED